MADQDNNNQQQSAEKQSNSKSLKNKVIDSVKKQSRNKTLTGQPVDQIEINPVLNNNINNSFELNGKLLESAGKHVVIVPGRFQPPTEEGHGSLIKQAESHAKDIGAETHVVASHSEGTSSNPIPLEKKKQYLGKIASKQTKIASYSKEKPSLFHYLSDLHKQGVKHVTIFSGSDREEDYDKVKKYNGVEGRHGKYNFESINFKTAGEKRDPNAKGAAGMSGSKLRGLAKDPEKFNDFKNGLAKQIRPHAKEIAGYINSVKEDIDLEFDDILEAFQNKQDVQISHLPGTQPAKYYVGLSKDEKLDRYNQFKKQTKMDEKDPDAYKLAPGDNKKSQVQSKYTKKYKKLFGEDVQSLLPIIQEVFDDVAEELEQLTEAEISALRKKAEKSGISYGTLKKVFNRGMAAWRTGHRPGTTPQQWAFARVNSYITKGKTYHTADKDLRETSIDDAFNNAINEYAVLKPKPKTSTYTPYTPAKPDAPSAPANQNVKPSDTKAYTPPKPSSPPPAPANQNVQVKTPSTMDVIKGVATQAVKKFAPKLIPGLNVVSTAKDVLEPTVANQGEPDYVQQQISKLKDASRRDREGETTGGAKPKPVEKPAEPEPAPPPAPPAPAPEPSKPLKPDNDQPTPIKPPVEPEPYKPTKPSAPPKPDNEPIKPPTPKPEPKPSTFPGRPNVQPKPLTKPSTFPARPETVPSVKPNAEPSTFPARPEAVPSAQPQPQSQPSLRPQTANQPKTQPRLGNFAPVSRVVPPVPTVNTTPSEPTKRPEIRPLLFAPGEKSWGNKTGRWSNVKQKFTTSEQVEVSFGKGPPKSVSTPSNQNNIDQQTTIKLPNVWDFTPDMLKPKMPKAKQLTPESVDSTFEALLDEKFGKDREAVTRSGQDRKSIDLTIRDKEDRKTDDRAYRQQSIVKKIIDEKYGKGYQSPWDKIEKLKPGIGSRIDAAVSGLEQNAKDYQAILDKEKKSDEKANNK